MKKTFCDYCNIEITQSNTIPESGLARTLSKNNRQLKVSIAPTGRIQANADICSGCLLEAAMTGTDTRAASQHDGEVAVRSGKH